MHKKRQKNNPLFKDIAVIGISGRFPGANNIAEFWDNLKNGKETISFFSEKELKDEGISSLEYKMPNYIKAKGIVENIEGFDADLFEYTPKEAEKMDPQLRILHECTWEALEDAGYDPNSLIIPTGAYFGANDNHEWINRINSLPSNGVLDFDAFILNYRDYIATRLSYKFNLKGPSFTLLTACSTSLVAIHLACQGIMNGECDMALAGGVSLSLPQKRGYFFQEGFMVSSDGHCRTFDAQADGTVFGDGVGVVVLKPLKRAVQDRDHIYAVVKGSAINNDGNGKMGFTAPSAEGQALVIQSALKNSGVKPEYIGFVEAHGTGTRLGDPIEIQALQQAFQTKKKAYCWIGSIKTNIGHLNIAAGIASFIKTVLTLKNGLIPSTLHFSKPNPGIDFENSPFKVNTQPVKWTTNGFPRRAGVSAFGFGGTNAHIILEEAPFRRRYNRSRPQQILVLSAKTESALEVLSQNLSKYLSEKSGLFLPDIAYTLSVGRKSLPVKRYLVCNSTQEAASLLQNDQYSAFNAAKKKPVVFLFPGQGSQYVNMGKDLYKYEKFFRTQVDNCAEILNRYLSKDIRELLYPPEDKQDEAHYLLQQTEFTQPVVFVFSYALARLWMKWGIKPQALIGHSSGECAAACIAGIFSLEDSLKLIAYRGKSMQELPRGRMLAVSLSEKKIKPFLNSHISLAAVNSPTLCVVSGEIEFVEKLKVDLRKKGIACQFLATSHAFHSHMMNPMIDPLSKFIQETSRQAPDIPIMSTVTSNWIKKWEMADPGYWKRNLRRTVQFSRAIKKLMRETDGILLEVGPGRTLSTLVKMHPDYLKNRMILSSMKQAKENLSDLYFQLNTLGKLWQSGVEIDWTIYYGEEKRNRMPLPTYPFEQRHFWIKNIPFYKDLAGFQEKLNTKIPDIKDWFYVPSWKRSIIPLNAQKNQKNSDYLVFMDAIGWGERLVGILQSEGNNIIKVHYGNKYIKGMGLEYTINPSRADDYESLYRSLRRQRIIPNKIIHLWNISDFKQGSLPELKRVKQLRDIGFMSLLYLAHIFGKAALSREMGVYVFSTGLHEVTGNEKIDPLKAPLLGPVKVIPQEYPNVKCSSIDLINDSKNNSSLQQIIAQLLTEIRSDIKDLVVAYRGNHRWIQSYEKNGLEKVKKAEIPVKKGGVYLITGGLGGIGTVLAEFLAKSTQGKLILTGRTPFPARTQWNDWIKSQGARNSISRKIQKIQKLENYGAHVYIVTADVTSRKKMKSKISQLIEKIGPLNGVIHAAGLPGEGILQLKTPESAKKILAPKTEGTLILEEITKGMKLDFFILCSSIASILGGIGLSDYCAANSFLDALAAQKNNLQQNRFIAVNWDMWGQVGMGLKTQMPVELKEWFERELRNGITSSEGVEVFKRILSHPISPQIVVSTRDLQVRIDLWLKRELIKQKEEAVKEETSAPKYSRPNLSTCFSEPNTPTEKKAANIWCKLFGIEKVGRDDNFYELGGHSLLAATLLSELRKICGTNISIRDVLDNPTIRELGSLIDKSAKSQGKSIHVN